MAHLYTCINQTEYIRDHTPLNARPEKLNVINPFAQIGRNYDVTAQVSKKSMQKISTQETKETKIALQCTMRWRWQNIRS